jgi:hypothetical protein
MQTPGLGAGPADPGNRHLPELVRTRLDSWYPSRLAPRFQPSQRPRTRPFLAAAPGPGSAAARAAGRHGAGRFSEGSDRRDRQPGGQPSRGDSNPPPAQCCRGGVRPGAAGPPGERHHPHACPSEPRRRRTAGPKSEVRKCGTDVDADPRPLARPAGKRLAGPLHARGGGRQAREHLATRRVPAAPANSSADPLAGIRARAQERLRRDFLTWLGQQS